MHARKDVSELVQNISHSPDGTGPPRKTSPSESRERRTHAIDRNSAAVSLLTTVFGTFALMICSLCIRIALGTGNLVFLVLLVPALPWAITGLLHRLDKD